MKLLLAILLLCFASKINAQSYSTTIDTFYVQTPEYNAVGIDSLHFPSAITKPDVGTDFPLLILVHGTAALDYNSTSSKDYLDSVGATYRKAQTAMFYEIADSLSKAGIMVLRYDKRSYTLNCIEQPQCWYLDTVSPYDYINDIHNAVDFAKTLADVDTCNIFLAGHSQGGSFVSQVGYDRSDIRGVLNMAGLAEPIDSIAVHQTEFINADPVGASIMRNQFDSLRMGLWPMSDTLYGAHFSPRFWLDWISHSDSAIYVQKNSDKPTALMYGTADRFVPASIHYQIWQDSVTRPNATFQLFTDIDHGFGTEYDSLMSPQVLGFMANWIHATTELCTASINNNDYSEALVSLYPNPAREVLNIKFDKNRNTDFKVYNLLGEIVANGVIRNSNTCDLDINNLRKGVYLIQIGEFSARFVKH